MSLSEKLKTLRNDHNWTQDYVAKLMKVTRPTISRYETGKTIPTYQTVIELAGIYGVDKNELLEILIEETPKPQTIYTSNIKTDDLEFAMIHELLEREPKWKDILLELYTLDEKRINIAVETMLGFIKGLKQ